MMRGLIVCLMKWLLKWVPACQASGILHSSLDVTTIVVEE